MLKLLKQKIAKSFKSGRLNVFLLFLLLSFSVLIFTKLSQKYSNTLIINIDANNVPATQILQLDSTPKMEVSYSDYGFKILYHGFKTLNFPIDFKDDVEAKDRLYIWKSKQNVMAIENFLGNTSEVLSIKPDSIVFSFDTLSTKKVPVILKSKIDYKLGYDALDSVILQPDSVKLIGADSRIKKIKSLNTKQLVLSSIEDDVNQSITIEVPKEFEDVRISPKTVNVSIPVDKFTEGEVEVPVIVNNISEAMRINYFPKAIKVVYYVSLENYKNVKATDFKIVCDFAEAQDRNQSYFIPKLTIENNKVKSARMKQDKVEYIIVR